MTTRQTNDIASIGVNKQSEVLMNRLWAVIADQDLLEYRQIHYCNV